MALTRSVFSDDALQKAVDNAMNKIPEGHKFAVVAHADLNGASVTAVSKVNDHWTIQAACIKPWKGPLSAEAEVIASW